MIAVWHFIVHIMGVDYGAPYGHWVWYDFHSGIAGDIYFTALLLLPTWYYQHTCHDHPTCLRWGKHKAAGGTFKLCWKHHPDMGEKPNHEMIHRLHREYQESQK